MAEEPITVTVELGTGEGREVHEVQPGDSFTEVTDGSVWIQVTVPEGADTLNEDTESDLDDLAPDYTSTEAQEETGSNRVSDADRVRCVQCGEQYPGDWTRCHECGTKNQ